MQGRGNFLMRMRGDGDCTRYRSESRGAISDCSPLVDAGFRRHDEIFLTGAIVLPVPGHPDIYRDRQGRQGGDPGLAFGAGTEQVGRHGQKVGDLLRPVHQGRVAHRLT